MVALMELMLHDGGEELRWNEVCLLTFNLGGWLSAGVQDWPLPCNVEVAAMVSWREGGGRREG